jgi:hypothetical protein
MTPHFLLPTPLLSTHGIPLPFIRASFFCRDPIDRVHDLSKNVSSKILSYHTKMAINQIFTVEEQPLLSSTAQACSAELYSGTM